MARVQNEGAQIRRLVREREQIGEVSEFLQPLSDLQVASSTPSADSEKCGETQMGSASPIGAVTVTADMLSLLATHPGSEREVDSFHKNWYKRFDKPTH